MRGGAILVLAACTAALSGCVAAIIPLGAGAALLRSTASPDAPVAAAVAHSAPSPSAASIAPTAGAASDRSDLRIVRTSLSSLPPPDPIAAIPSNATIAAFKSYALAQAAPPAGAGKRTSAIIPEASALRLARGQCVNEPAAVFIDLDPGRGTFDPLAPGPADPSLVAALADLRGRAVEIVWFSRLGTAFADAARAALRDAGLDPRGKDELVLMSDLGERKQTRRDDIAKSLCPVAILGDERADFDELYLYLKNADAAVALDGMIGRGWFLASPFAPPPAIIAGANR